jgi:hypothetical protein
MRLRQHWRTSHTNHGTTFVGLGTIRPPVCPRHWFFRTASYLLRISSWRRCQHRASAEGDFRGGVDGCCEKLMVVDRCLVHRGIAKVVLGIWWRMLVDVEDKMRSFGLVLFWTRVLQSLISGSLSLDQQHFMAVWRNGIASTDAQYSQCPNLQKEIQSYHWSVQLLLPEITFVTPWMLWISSTRMSTTIYCFFSWSIYFCFVTVVKVTLTLHASALQVSCPLPW